MGEARNERAQVEAQVATLDHETALLRAFVAERRAAGVGAIEMSAVLLAVAGDEWLAGHLEVGMVPSVADVVELAHVLQGQVMHDCHVAACTQFQAKRTSGE